jgi:hypothetical protein
MNSLSQIVIHYEAKHPKSPLPPEGITNPIHLALICV